MTRIAARRALIAALLLCAVGTAAHAISGRAKLRPHWYCNANLPAWDAKGDKSDLYGWHLVMISGSQYDKSAKPSCQAL